MDTPVYTAPASSRDIIAQELTQVSGHTGSAAWAMPDSEINEKYKQEGKAVSESFKQLFKKDGFTLNRLGEIVFDSSIYLRIFKDRILENKGEPAKEMVDSA